MKSQYNSAANKKRDESKPRLNNTGFSLDRGNSKGLMAAQEKIIIWCPGGLVKNKVRNLQAVKKDNQDIINQQCIFTVNSPGIEK